MNCNSDDWVLKRACPRFSTIALKILLFCTNVCLEWFLRLFIIRWSVVIEKWVVGLAKQRLIV
jgi:hypothetical protein